MKHTEQYWTVFTERIVDENKPVKPSQEQFLRCASLSVAYFNACYTLKITRGDEFLMIWDKDEQRFIT